MTAIEALKNAYKNVFTIKGRACRKEFWMYRLSVTILVLILFAIELVVNDTITEDVYQLDWMGVVLAVVGLYCSIGLFTMSIRRLHDLNCSGWTVLLEVIPFVPILMEILLCFVKGTVGPNKFGPDPRAMGPIQ